MIERAVDEPDPSSFHSRRDPLEEATRFLEARANGRRPSALVSMAPASDWLAVAAERLWPGIRVASVQPDIRFRGREEASAALRWYPDSPVGIRDFLARALEGAVDGGVLAVEWRAALVRYPEFAAIAARELAEALRFLSTARCTERYWARRWLLNACRTFLRAEAYSAISPDARPVLLAGAGPGLEDALEALVALRERIRVWALASSAEACLSRGFRPELLVATDAGAWNLLHFKASAKIAVAAPFHAKLPPSIVEDGLLVPVDLGLFHDAPLFEASGAARVEAAPHGTAAGSASSLAAGLGAGAVFLAGVDFASDDLRDHARPYAFDALEKGKERRLSPSHSVAFERVATAYPARIGGRWRASRAFEAYSGAAFPCPVAYTLGGSPASPASLPRATTAFARAAFSRQDPDIAPVSGPRSVGLSRLDRELALREILSRLGEEVASELEALPPGTSLPERLRQGLEAFGGDRVSEWLAERARGRAGSGLGADVSISLRRSVGEILEELLG